MVVFLVGAKVVLLFEFGNKRLWNDIPLLLRINRRIEGVKNKVIFCHLRELNSFSKNIVLYIQRPGFEP